MKRIVIAAIATLFSVAALAQNAAESIEVRVVNVDVVVRDRAGKPVTGLTKEDFEVFENGQKREITNLYEVHAQAPGTKPAANAPSPAPVPVAAAETPVEIRPRNLVVFIDNYSLDPFRRDKVVQSLRKFLDTKLQPDDRVMIVVCTQEIKVVTPFTSDRKAIEDGLEATKKLVRAGNNRATALEQLKHRVGEYIDAGKEGRSPWRDYYEMSLSLVEGFVEEEIFNSRNTLVALGQVTAALNGLEGKNVVVFAGAHLPEHPGKETYLWLYTAFTPYLPLTMGTESISGKTGSMQHYSIEEAAKQASANNVALYLIDAADSRDAISAESGIAVDKMEQFTSFTNTAAAYQTLARISGGMALTNSDNFDAAFETLANDLNAYYSVGFRPASGQTPGLRTIVVKMKNPAYRFRARETYIPKAAAGPQDEMSTRVIANLYTTDPRNAWEIKLTPGTPEKVGSEYRVPFQVTMASTITLVPQDAGLAGNFAVYVVVGSGSNTSRVIRNVHTVKVPVDAEDDFRDKQFSYKATIAMNPGDNILSVAVIDLGNESNAGFARAKVQIP